MSLDFILWADPFGLITDLSSSLIIRMFNLGLNCPEKFFGDQFSFLSSLSAFSPC